MPAALRILALLVVVPLLTVSAGGLNSTILIGKSEIRRSFDEEAAIDLVLRLGLSEAPEVGLSPVIKYRLLVGGVGIACRSFESENI